MPRLSLNHVGQNRVSELYFVLNYSSSITSCPNMASPPILLFFKDFAFLGLLYINIHFRISLSNVKEKSLEIYLGLR